MNQKLVLLVDDDKDFIEQQSINLTAMGYQVATAYSAAEAQDWLARQQPDLAIVDLMMENTDSGFVLSYHIKKQHPEIPVILVTAVTRETGMSFDLINSEEKQWIKADAVLPKPIRFEQLASEIRRLVN